MLNETVNFHKQSLYGQEMGSLSNKAKALRWFLEMSALKAARFAVREENTYCFPDLQVKIAQNKNIKIFFLKKKGGKGGEQ